VTNPLVPQTSPARRRGTDGCDSWRSNGMHQSKFSRLSAAFSAGSHLVVARFCLRRRVDRLEKFRQLEWTRQSWRIASSCGSTTLDRVARRYAL
jgi:hypothetical protein